MKRTDHERRKHPQSFTSISLAEIVDIIFVAILLYAAIVWTQRTRAVFVVRGM
ncbi:MAG TPA: hypothetical protein VFR80_04415 [Pyrinomonadaceae bacterium]|nr:hypothetical protein [Pyrinomonadaceae bacterium]